MKRIALLLAVLVFFTFSGNVLAAKTEKAPDKVLTQLKSMINKGRFDDALSVADKALTARPSDSDVAYYKIEALMGLGRYKIAARDAMKWAARNPKNLEFRYLAGNAAFNLGLIPPALRNWSLLLKDREWCVAGCRACVRGLLATGKEAEARKLVETTIGRWKEPMPDLLRLRLNLTDSGPVGVKTAASLIKADPENKEEYEGLMRLYGEVGNDTLFKMDPIKSYPVKVPMKLKSERKSFSALVWGSMDTGTAEVTTTPSVVVTVSINDTRREWVTFDSGADTVLISPEWAEKLGLKEVASAEYIGLGAEGARKSGWVMLKKLAVGPVVFRNVPAMVLSKKEDYFKDIGGIIPVSLFRKQAVCLDRRHRKITVYPGGTSPSSVMGERSYRVKSLWVWGKPFIQVSLNGHQGKYCLLDTGAFATFLSREKAASIGIKGNSARYDSQMTSGLSGSSSTAIADDVKMVIGRSAFNMRRVYVQDLGSGWGVDCWGLIGQKNVLTLMKLFFDYSNNTVAFCPAD